MTIFDPAPFFATEFTESVSYYVNGSSTANIIDAVITRHDRKSFSQQRYDNKQTYYPYEIMIKKDDIDAITIKRDSIDLYDKASILKNVVVQEVVYSDSGVWVIGAI